jgi:hypothetical protein
VRTAHREISIQNCWLRDSELAKINNIKKLYHKLYFEITSTTKDSFQIFYIQKILEKKMGVKWYSTSGIYISQESLRFS